MGRGQIMRDLISHPLFLRALAQSQVFLFGGMIKCWISNIFNTTLFFFYTWWARGGGKESRNLFNIKRSRDSIILFSDRKSILKEYINNLNGSAGFFSAVRNFDFSSLVSLRPASLVDFGPKHEGPCHPFTPTWIANSMSLSILLQLIFERTHLPSHFVLRRTLQREEFLSHFTDGVTHAYTGSNWPRATQWNVEGPGIEAKSLWFQRPCYHLLEALSFY